MLSDLDDHPIGQTPAPWVPAVTGDRDFSERYFFSGFSSGFGFLFDGAP